MALGLFKFRWQGFLAATTTVAVVNAAVAGTAAATLLGSVWTATPVWGLATFGIVVAIAVSAAFLRYQMKVWRRVAAALPGVLRERDRELPADRAVSR